MEKIDKFYFALAGLLILLALVILFVVQNIFGSFNKANDLSSASLQSNSPHVIDSKLNAAENALNNKKFTPLDLH